MGIFDTIEVAHTCTCGKLYADYKTHALGNVLETYRLGERLNIPDLEIVIGSFELHSYCSNCQKSIEGKGYIKDGLLWRVVEMDDKGKENVIAEYVPG